MFCFRKILKFWGIKKATIFYQYDKIYLYKFDFYITTIFNLSKIIKQNYLYLLEISLSMIKISFESSEQN